MGWLSCYVAHAAGSQLDSEWARLRKQADASSWSPFVSREDEEAHDSAAAMRDEGVEEDERQAIDDAISRRVYIEKESQRRLAGESGGGVARTGRKPRVPNAGSTHLLSDLITAWAKERQPQPRTVQIAERCSRRFRELVGPLPVETIARQQVIQFKDALLASGQTAVNTDKILTMFSTLLPYAHDQGWLPSNPAKGVKVGTRSNAKMARLPFDLPALKLLFGSTIYTAGERPGAGAGEAAYWLPLLALYAGARLEELAQLTPTDISETPYSDTNGAQRTCWIFTITDAGEGQQVKTAGSRRRVPIHPELIALGFIEYARSVTGPRLFPALKPNNEGREGALFGKWFGKHKRAVGITDKRMVFHSFRHLFKNVMREAGVDEAVHDALTGRGRGSGPYLRLRNTLSTCAACRCNAAVSDTWSEDAAALDGAVVDRTSWRVSRR
ncbi:site-specific integrase [Paraburkholderia phytofirmans]|uniref:Integrase family protein n=1 Tax=Paraburkholderia phytofirmans (strain DSM 17436 / LMG 22146 / PsJN) TaxID=398527 RepID=B2TBA6_PARPJ|nr:site-specific integrase [Paraburkholderia phytofirmans]ACD20848.1 hypothetical protein Bphyt_6546 [Paraburkholderia phytofirmans PsJN]